MPYESPAQVEARRSMVEAKAEAAKDRRRLLDEEVAVRVKTALASEFCRGFDELAALMHVSDRMAQDIAARPDFPKPKAIGDRVRLWSVAAVVAWINQQPETLP